jgi:hypothetical protein
MFRGKARLGWTVCLTLCLCLASSSRSSACWLCSVTAGSSDVVCELDIGETGGTTCITNCKTIGGVDKCFCRTLGDCSGSNGCDGHPCPMLRASSTQQESGKGKVFLTRETYRALEASHPDAAMLLANFVKDGDVLEVGLKASEPFIPGEYKGLFTEAPTGGRPDLKKTYRFEASVTEEENGIRVDVRIFDHPSMQSLHAQIQNGGVGNLIEVTDLRGRVSRIME